MKNRKTQRTDKLLSCLLAAPIWLALFSTDESVQLTETIDKRFSYIVVSIVVRMFEYQYKYGRYRIWMYITFNMEMEFFFMVGLRLWIIDSLYRHLVHSFKTDVSVARERIVSIYVSAVPFFAILYKSSQSLHKLSGTYYMCMHYLFKIFERLIEFNDYRRVSNSKTPLRQLALSSKFLSEVTICFGKIRNIMFKKFLNSKTTHKIMRSLARTDLPQVVLQPTQIPFFNSLLNIGRTPIVQPVRITDSNTLHYIAGCRFFWDHFFIRQSAIRNTHDYVSVGELDLNNIIKIQDYVDLENLDFKNIIKLLRILWAYCSNNDTLQHTIRSKDISDDCSKVVVQNTRIFEPFNRIARLGTFYNAVEELFQELFDEHKEICTIDLEHEDALNFNRQWFISWIPEALRAFDEYLFNDNDILVFSSRMADAHKIRFVQKAYYAPFIIPVRFFEWLCFGECSVNKYLHILTYEHLHSLFFDDDMCLVTHKYSCAEELNRSQDLVAQYKYTVLGHAYNLGI